MLSKNVELVWFMNGKVHKRTGSGISCQWILTKFACCFHLAFTYHLCMIVANQATKFLTVRGSWVHTGRGGGGARLESQIILTHFLVVFIGHALWGGGGGLLWVCASSHASFHNMLSVFIWSFSNKHLFRKTPKLKVKAVTLTCRLSRSIRFVLLLFCDHFCSVHECCAANTICCSLFPVPFVKSRYLSDSVEMWQKRVRS